MSRPAQTDLAQSSTEPPLGQESVSPWSPLRQPVFRALWIASVVSNVGTWMHDTSAAWLMTSLAPSPLMVSLMQTATTLPFFLLALPAGALADIVDRRRLLISTQVWMLLAATALVHELTLATRNATDFPKDVSVVNPWQ